MFCKFEPKPFYFVFSLPQVAGARQQRVDPPQRVAASLQRSRPRRKKRQVILHPGPGGDYGGGAMREAPKTNFNFNTFDGVPYDSEDEEPELGEEAYWEALEQACQKASHWSSCAACWRTRQTSRHRMCSMRKPTHLPLTVFCLTF